MKVVSLCPSNTEVIAYLGLEDLLVGVDDFSDWPSIVQKLPKLGPDLSIDLDLVEALQPDLVLASLSVPGMEKNIEGLKKRGIPHLILNPQSLEDIKNDLILTADRLGYPKRGKEAAKQFQERVEKVRLTNKCDFPIPSLYWEWWPKPVFSPGKINWLNEISEIAGAKNVFSDINKASVQTDWEDVLSRKPDFICLAWVGVRHDKVNPTLVMKRPGWRELEAENKGKIIVLEEELYCRPSPRLLDGLEKLSEILINHRYSK